MTSPASPVSPSTESTGPSAVARRPQLRHPMLRDRFMLAIAGLFIGDTTLLLVFLLPLAEPGWATLVSRLLVLLATVALAFRNRWPAQVGALILVLAIVYYPTGEQDGVLMMILFAAALYSVAARGQLVASGVLASCTVLAMAYSESVTRARGDGYIDDMAFLLIIGWLVGVVGFGHAMRVRQAYLGEAEQRARAAERERDARAHQSATAERLRIARELHDVLGHNISMINVQSAATLHRAGKRPGETAELLTALESVRDISREALRELRDTLGVLRQVDEAAPVAPAASGLERIGELAERASGSGLRVTVRQEGVPADVPPQISLAAYRIVQESLTNVTRHSGADRADVVVTCRSGSLHLVVEDNGAGPAPDSTTGGSGIDGMAERARALGGHLSACGVLPRGGAPEETEGAPGEAPGAGPDERGVADRDASEVDERGENRSATVARVGFRVTAELPLPPRRSDDGTETELADPE